MALFQEEFLNSIDIAGMPPHNLNISIGSPVVLLRNIDPDNGLCNGTRLLIKKITSRLLTVTIMNGPNEGQDAHICRLDLLTAEGSLPFTLKRRQFPVKLAFAMTINKAQGQSFEICGVYLSNPVFSHGQLYVAMSRAAVAASMKLFIVDRVGKQGNFIQKLGKYTKNVVYQEVLL